MKRLLDNPLSSKDIGSIINDILEKQYPTHRDSIPLSELLGWDLWEIFINISRKYIHFILNGSL